MKYFFSISFLVLSLCLTAQSKKTIKLLNNTRLLEEAVFDTKDSVTLEKLFARTLYYEHSSGKIESREQAMQGIIHNKSIYIISSPQPTAIDVLEKGDSVVTKKVFKATQKKEDGTESFLDLTIEMIWVKENGDWKLARRKALRNEQKQ